MVQRFKSINHSILRWLLVISLLPLVVAITLNYQLASSQIQQVVQKNLIDQVQSQQAFIEQWFQLRFIDTQNIATSPTTIDVLQRLTNQNNKNKFALSEFITSPNYQSIVADYPNYFAQRWSRYDYIANIILVDTSGNVVYSIPSTALLATNLLTANDNLKPLRNAIRRSLDSREMVFTDLFKSSNASPNVSGFISSPVLNDKEQIIGALALQLKTEQIQTLLEMNASLGGNQFILNSSNELKLASKSVLEASFDQVIEKPPTKHELELANNATNISLYDTQGINNRPVISVHNPITVGHTEWTIVNETEKAFAFTGNDKIITLSLAMLILCSVLIAAFSIYVSSQLTHPIKMLNHVIKKFGKGENISHKLIYSNNEIGVLSKAFSKLIKDRKQQDDNMKETLGIQKAILENLGEALIMIDNKGIIRKFSRSAEKLFKYSETEMLGANVSMLMPKNVAIHHDQYLQGQDDQHSRNIIDNTRVVKGVKKDGSVFDMELIVTKITQSNSKYYIGLVRDITKTQEAQKKLVKALKVADAANQSKGDFLAEMSHEIRTPLDGIFGSLQVIEDKNKQDEISELIDNALFSCRSLLTIIDNILDLSKIEAGMLSFEDVSFKMDNVINSVVTELMPLAQKKELSLTVKFGDSFQDGWIGDPKRIKQIIQELVANAIRFTQVGSVSIELHSDMDSWGNTRLKVQILDTGIGMNQRSLDRVFKRFEQADNATRQQFGGTGLGMAIIKNLLENMNGEIDIKSEKNNGTQVYLTLPLLQSNTPPIETTQPESLVTPDLSDKTILLAEDNMINQVVFRAMMAQTNANLITVFNGKEAISIFEKHEVDMIFMDIQMPEMDGIEACKIIREKELNHTPIIALTANVMKEDITHYEQVGFDDCLAKPVELSQLYKLAAYL